MEEYLKESGVKRESRCLSEAFYAGVELPLYVKLFKADLRRNK